MQDTILLQVFAWLAQLVERDPYTVDVGGSRPSPGTKFLKRSV